VHLGIPSLLAFYREHGAEEALVLAVVIATEGSTYRKPGAMMLISRDGSFEGMISGGCLEGDLLHHADRVFKHGEPTRVTYDMGADEELVWNLGLGCDGVIHLLLIRLERESGFGFLEQLDASHGDRRAALVALTTRTSGSALAGATALRDRSERSIGDPALQRALRDAAEDWPEWRYRRVALEDDEGVAEVLLIHMPPQVRVVVCGAGPDAVPVARALAELDWDIQVVDHRPAYARASRFPAGCRVAVARPAELAAAVELDGVDAVVIMSHHLENDALYLRQVTDRDIPYIGVLGPAARRQRLCEMADCDPERVHGPVGLDIGAELPAAIALSLVAEIHAVLNRRDGTSLTARSGNND
jgi:xanthine/CO dehydrogenase XdhC/CoxF family maturation factor